MAQEGPEGDHEVPIIVGDLRNGNQFRPESDSFWSEGEKVHTRRVG
jgi:hypothetical protein